MKIVMKFVSVHHKVTDILFDKRIVLSKKCILHIYFHFDILRLIYLSKIAPDLDNPMGRQSSKFR